jgi:cyclic pyranopterin phosphate synthase
MIYELELLPEAERLDSSTVSALQAPRDFSLTYAPAKGRAHVLSDSFGRMHKYLRISLVEHCNLQCSYCMPEGELDWTPTDELLTDDEIIRLARLFVGQGVTKIRLTGGEPLLRPGIEKIVETLASLPRLKTLAITTNGLLIKRKLPKLQAAGLNLVNLSLDTLQPDRFEAITRRDGLGLVLEAIDVMLKFGYNPVKINCVVMRGVNEDELVDFVDLTREKSIEVRFIEFMPFDDNRWSGEKLVPYEEMLRVIRQVYPLESLACSPESTAKLYSVPGFRGRVGFITSMTEDFCESCDRLRITADGNLKVCLFGRAEISLQHAMRSGASDQELLELISTAVGGKHARHAGMHAIAASRNRPMITIGG